MPIVAIHQPNFFPWLGYFDKLARCDTFVCLDNVQLPKTGGSWINRVKLLVGGTDQWATAPVRRGAGVQSIVETQFNEASPWRRKLITTVEASYGKAPHFRAIMDFLRPLVMSDEMKVSVYNLRVIKQIAERLSIDTEKVVLSSELLCEGHSNDLLVSLVRRVDGTTYLCGGGAESYQQDALFHDAGVSVRHQGFDHPRYPQHGNKGEFVAGLSIIDALMNIGFADTRALLAPKR